MNWLAYFQGLLVLALIMAVLVALAWMVKRGMGDRLGGQMRGMVGIRGVWSLGARERLVLVEHQGQWLLLGVTPSAITLLSRTELSEAELAESGTQTTAAALPPVFAQWLNKLRRP